MKKNFTKYEPDPIKNLGESMHDLVIDDLSRAFPTSLDVQEDMKDRKEFGLEKYGVVLQVDNGRNPLIDAYQEVLDLLVYLKQELKQRKKDDVSVLMSKKEQGVKPDFNEEELELMVNYVAAMNIAISLRKMI